MSLKLDKIVQTGSPLWLENKISDWNQKIFDKILSWIRLCPYVFFIGLTILSLLALFFQTEIVEFLFPVQYQTWFHGDWPRLRLWTSVFILIFGPVLWKFRDKDPLQISIVSFCATILYLMVTAPSFLGMTVRVLSIFSFFLLVVAPLLYWHKWKIEKKIVFLIIILLAYLFGEYFIKNQVTSIRWFREAGFILLVRSFIPISLCLVEHHIHFNAFVFSNRKLLSYLISPMTFLFLMPIKSIHWVQAKDSLAVRLQGLCDLLVCFLAYLLTTLLLKYFPKGESLFLDGLRTSFAYFLSSWGFFRAAVSMGRWFGYDLPDASHFAVLSTNPIESWRRWSIYLYEWMLTIIFLPIVRWTKSLWFGFLMTFVVLFLVHYFNALPGVVFGFTKNSPHLVWVRNNFFFFLSHGLLVYISSQIKFWPSSNSWKGWLGVITTWCLFGLIHIFVSGK